MSRSIVVRWSLCRVVLGACARTVMDQPVNRVGDGWTLVVSKVTDGPNSVDEGNVIIKPKEGDRFIWVHLTLRNDQRQPRKFSFDRCDLDMGRACWCPAW
jgi:hypothetical protein